MNLTCIALVLCTCVWLTVGDVSHLKATKAKLLGRLAGKIKHHKRGIISAVPPYKLGHDIPVVTHSVVKPLVVSYPSTAAVTAVKVPLSHPLIQRYPLPVGHRVPVPHPHYGLKFPHHTKATVLVPKPDHHFHHHHHYVEPTPVVPLDPGPVPVAPVAPVPQPTATLAQPLPVTAPTVIQPAPVLPASVVHHHVPVAPPVPVIPNNIQLKPLLPASVPIQPSQVIEPAYPYSQIPYILRPGNAIQTSFFATYPRYAFNYQSPLIPLATPAANGPVLFDRPQVPHLQLMPQGGAHEGVVIEQSAPTVPVGPTTLLHPAQVGIHQIPQPSVHLHHAQPEVQYGQPGIQLQSQPNVPLDHDGWNPVPAQPHDLSHQHPGSGHYPQDGYQFTQEQGTQLFEQHAGEDHYNDFQHQLQHHIQQQIEQAQYEQNFNNHQPSSEYGVPQPLSNEYGQPNQNFPQNGQDFNFSHQQNQQGHDYNFEHQQNSQFAQHGHDYNFDQQQNTQFAQNGQDFNLAQQPSSEYGQPQAEGRSVEAEGEAQKYHNHIPLGLQPPIDRPLDQFQ